jgi:regulator of protease activity HflC (stomatin/prohibitin superfamily)
MIVVVLVVVVVVVLGAVASGVRVLTQYERAVLFHLGKVSDGARGPGLIFFVPLINRVDRPAWTRFNRCHHATRTGLRTKRDAVPRRSPTQQSIETSRLWPAPSSQTRSLSPSL